MVHYECTLVAALILLAVCIFFVCRYFEKDGAGPGTGTGPTVFPYRALCNENRELIPVVALTAFFRSVDDIKRYENYLANGTKVVGFTSYKTFPKTITDNTGDKNTIMDGFDYIGKIKNWVVCFKDPKAYGFNDSHNMIEMSESDFKDAEEAPPTVEKKYDFIYICIQDLEDSCPLDGWNATNRNFDLALKCFPIMINEFGLKLLVIGRKNCGLEEKYGDKIEVVNMLPYQEFQEKLSQSKYLFVPNIYDASPRVVTEAIAKNIPVLMNRNIVCGSKYINYETGELFTNENDIRTHLQNMLGRQMSPQKWWRQNYSKKAAGIKFRNYLYSLYPDVPMLQNSKEVYFF